MSSFVWIDETEKQWDGMAESWSSRSRQMWEAGSRKDIVPFFKTFVPSGAVVCDLGCGDGTGTGKLATAGYSVSGVDVSDNMLKIARENLKGCSVTLHKGDLLETGFPANTFDALLAVNSLEWTSCPYEALKEMMRILKPGGFACIGILGPTAAPRKNSFQRLYGKESICNTIMPWELEKLAEENAWKKIDEYGVYKKAATQVPHGSLPLELRQALAFMWVFMLQNEKKEN